MVNKHGYMWQVIIPRRCMLKYSVVKYRSVYNLCASVKTTKICFCMLFPILQKGRYGGDRDKERERTYMVRC